MSPNRKRGWNPSPPARLNIDEIERVKKLFEDSTLAKYIIMAGVSGVVVGLIELVRFIVQCVHGHCAN